MATKGLDIHGEADLVSSFQPTSVLDAGCGTGRVAVELARRGIDVTGLDLDEHMLAAAHRKAPELRWVLGDLAAIDLNEADGSATTFDAVVAAGNVMIYLAPGSEPTVIGQLAGRLNPGGHLIAGFQLRAERISLASYDDCCRQHGLELAARYSTWDGAPYDGDGGYAVSVHRR
jgi:2-polyprenyl-3-methyl-5-hydroxy-6-metoxy-1,4-benzoquinol methylase